MPESRSARAIRFGPFEVNPYVGELRKRGIRIKLSRQPFEVLTLLLERPGEVVTYEELRAKIWQADTFVDFEHGLHAAVNKLRQALDDSAERSRYVQTLPHRGYRFVGTVRRKADAPEARAAVHGEKQPAPEQMAASAGAAPRRWASGRHGATLLAIAVVLAALGIGYPSLRNWRQPSAATAPRIQSLAVLPLENLSRDPEQEYFADGMTDELITDLARIGALRVISRTSVMRYKGTKKSLPEIARELNVDAVVEGTVSRSPGRVHITAQLILARPEKHLWAEGYDRALGDALALQSELARAITTEIKIKVTPQEQVLLASARPVNPEGHEAYLKGRYYWNKRTEEGFGRSIEYFSEAIEKDPNYALAYAGLADSYILLGEYSLFPTKEAYTKAREAATKALALDETMAEAHTALADVKTDYDWDWPGAEREFRRAIELNPGYATAHQWYGELLSELGRHEEALAEIKRARQLDPLSLIISTVGGQTLLRVGRDDLAVEQLRKTLEIDPNFAQAHDVLGLTYLRKRAFAEAIAEFQRAITLSPNITLYKAGLGQAYARTGKSSEARKLLYELKQQSKRSYVSWLGLADIYAGLAERDQAFACVELAYEQRDANLVQARVDPLLDPLHSDPRFQDLLRRMGLPP